MTKKPVRNIHRAFMSCMTITLYYNVKKWTFKHTFIDLAK